SPVVRCSCQIHARNVPTWHPFLMPPLSSHEFLSFTSSMDFAPHTKWRKWKYSTTKTSAVLFPKRPFSNTANEHSLRTVRYCEELRKILTCSSRRAKQRTAITTLSPELSNA